MRKSIWLWMWTLWHNKVCIPLGYMKSGEVRDNRGLGRRTRDVQQPFCEWLDRKAH